MTTTTEARLPEDVMELEVQVTERSSEIVRRMSDELELWAGETEAALFLAGLALARGQEPVDEADREPADVTLGRLADAGDPSELDALAIVGIVEDGGDELDAVLAEALPGWIEAGAELAAPHLDGTDPVEASGEILALIRDVE